MIRMIYPASQVAEKAGRSSRSIVVAMVFVRLQEPRRPTMSSSQNSGGVMLTASLLWNLEPDYEYATVCFPHNGRCSPL